MPTVTFELEVAAAQELARTVRATVKKIDWILENPKPSMRPGELSDLDIRAKILTLTANIIETALHARALAIQNNVVSIKK